MSKVLDFWHSRWEEGRHGWHETEGSEALKTYWPRLSAGSRVLVPLCGKSTDLLWLAQRGCEVTGVELSPIAARSFFDESDLSYQVTHEDGFQWYRNKDAGIAIACGNYFEFSAEPFDALYDRAALTAISPKKRPEYARHTDSLLNSGATRLLLTLEFNDAQTEGPPYSISPGEVLGYWPGLERVDEKNDIENSSPRIREAGVDELIEVVWLGVG